MDAEPPPEAQPHGVHRRTPDQTAATATIVLTHVYLIRYSNTVRYVVLLTEDVADWLQSCHPTKTERDKIIARFRFVFGLLREFGLPIGRPHIDRIDGYANLWEVRIDHRTGAYRAFFGLAQDGAVIVVAHGAVKKRDRFPPAVYKQAEHKVEDAVARYDKERRTHGEQTRFVPAP